MRRKDLLDLQSLTAEEITYLLDTAQSFREIVARPVKKVPTLRGKSVATLFFVLERAELEAGGEPRRSNVLTAWREPRTLLVGVMVLGFAFTEGSANDWMAVAMVLGNRAIYVPGVAGLFTLYGWDPAVLWSGAGQFLL